MADPEFLDIQRIHMGVTAVIRKYKLNTAVLDDINAVFGKSNPTMRAKTETATKLTACSKSSVYRCSVRYRPGYSYITVVGDDGIDVGQKLWLVMAPTVMADTVRANVRRLVREHGLRGLLSHNCGGELVVFPRSGEEVPIETALKNPGIYLYNRFSHGGQPTVFVVHPKK